MSITGAALVIDTMLMVFVSHHGAYAQAIIGMRIRTAVSSLLYRKVKIYQFKTNILLFNEII